MDKAGGVGRNRPMSDAGARRNDAALAARLHSLVRRLEQLDQADRIALAELQHLLDGLLTPRADGLTDAGEIRLLRAENRRLRRMLAVLLDRAEDAQARDATAHAALMQRLPSD